MRIFGILTALLIFIIALPGQTIAATVTLSPGQSIQSAINSANSGDTIYLKSGTYKGSVSLNKSNITLATAPGESSRAIISGDQNGNNLGDTGDVEILVDVRGSNVTIENVEVAYSGKYGFFIGGGSGAKIKNNNVHHVLQAGIFILAPNTLIENNTVWRTADSNYCGGVNGKRGCSGDWDVGIVVGNSRGTSAPGPAPNTVIRGNTVYHNSGEGIDCEHNDNIIIENNIVYDNWGMGIYLDQCSNITIRNNLVYYTSDKNWWRNGDRPSNTLSISNEGIAGYSIVGHDRLIYNNILVGGRANFNFYLHPNMRGAYLSNDLFANNTLVNVQGSSSGRYGIEIENAAHKNTRFVNNIIYEPAGTIADVGSGLIFNNNLWSKQPVSAAAGNGDIVNSSPGMLDANHGITFGSVSADWYKLSANSPAINKGVLLSQVTTDFSGIARSNPPDIGAFEFGSGGGNNPTRVLTQVPLSPTASAVKAGDANGDGNVDGVDYVIWLNNYNKNVTGGKTNGDFDLNGFVDGVDYVVWLNNYGK